MNSKAYWSQREAEQLRHNVIDELEYNKQIQQIYDYMLDNVQKEINGFYSRYASKEGISLSEAKKRVTQLDIEAYERKAKRYVAEKTFTPEANEEMRLYNATMKINRLEMLKANIGLETVSGFNDLQKYFDTTLTDRTLSEFKRQAGILGKTVQDNQKLAHSIVNGSFHNARFSDRIWMYQAQLKDELDNQLQIGLIQGRNPRQLATHISKVFGARRSDAERLMQTELARVQTEAQKQSFERNDYDQYEFIAEPTACPICKAIDGKIFAVKDMMPGENASPIHPNCRCSAAGYLDREEFDKWLNEIETQGNKIQPKSIVKSGSSGTMEMYRRKGATHRKQSTSGSHIIDKATYHKITNPAIKRGADIRIADKEWADHLKDENATAVTIGKTIIFRSDATVSDVLEEVYHFRQNQKGLNNNYDAKQRTILNEIDAKEYLLSVADRYQIPEEELRLTKEQLKSYKREMEDMKKRGEWND